MELLVVLVIVYVALLLQLLNPDYS
jgi:hypothetical protein